MSEIDWSKKSEYECTCGCGNVFISQAAMIPRQAPGPLQDKGFKLVSKKACPVCGKNDVRSMRQDYDPMGSKPVVEG